MSDHEQKQDMDMFLAYSEEFFLVYYLSSLPVRGMGSDLHRLPVLHGHKVKVLLCKGELLLVLWALYKTLALNFVVNEFIFHRRQLAATGFV